MAPSPIASQSWTNGGTDYLRYSSDGFGSSWCTLYDNGRKAPPPKDLVALACKVLAGLPKFPRKPLCAGRPHLFDGDDPAGIDTAIAMCNICPCLESCKAWVATQAPNQLSGVLAGVVHTHPADQRQERVRLKLRRFHP